MRFYFLLFYFSIELLRYFLFTASLIECLLQDLFLKRVQIAKYNVIIISLFKAFVTVNLNLLNDRVRLFII